MCNFVNITAARATATTGAQPLVALAPGGDLVLMSSALIIDIPIAGLAAAGDPTDPVLVTISRCIYGLAWNEALSGNENITLGGVPATGDRLSAAYPPSSPWTVVNLTDFIHAIPVFKLTATQPFSPSGTFSPYPVQVSPSTFGLGSAAVSAGVLATIFGILSFIAFLFLMYLRRGATGRFQIIGRFCNAGDFDGVHHDYDDEQFPEDMTQGTMTTEHGPDYSYSYSVSYEYDYSEDP
jgi:hypothetical protein